MAGTEVCNVEFFAWTSRKLPVGNIGDELNRILWPRLLPELQMASPDTLFLGVGSVLDRRHPPNRPLLIFGAGARSPDRVPSYPAAHIDLRFVRGPLTASALGLSADASITDPAILSREVFRELPIPGDRHKEIGFVPYFRTDPGYAARLARRAGLKLIPTSLPPEQFLAALLGCRAVVSEAMHGAVLADTWGIPWLPCQISSLRIEKDTHAFKWADWMSSMDVRRGILNLPDCEAADAGSAGRALSREVRLWYSAWKIRRAIARGHWGLSERPILRARLERMREALEYVRRDYAPVTG